MVSCIKRQKGSPTPEIEYLDFQAFKRSGDNDTSYHLLKFLDGDGDLFRNIESNEGPNFMSKLFYFNNDSNKFIPYVQIVKDPTTGVVLGIDSFPYKQTVTNPKDVSFKDQSINGTILIPSKEYRPSNSVKKFYFTYYMVDRAGNKSNVVTTPTITVQ